MYIGKSPFAIEAVYVQVSLKAFSSCRPITLQNALSPVSANAAAKSAKAGHRDGRVMA